MRGRRVAPPPEYSEVVYTGSNNDSKLLKEFHLDPKKERQIRKSFGKLDQMPKILIVTEKLRRFTVLAVILA